MKILAVLKYLCLAGGALLLAGAAMSYQGSKQFIDSALSTSGVVVELLERRGQDSTTYAPVVAFIDTDEQARSFTSGLSSSPAAYAVGERVGVLYLPGQADDARIDNFAERWGSTVALLGFGAPVLAIGLVMVLLGQWKKRRKQYLQRHGQVVTAEFEAVIANQSVSINGRNPFVIVCHWLNPETSRLHVLESENIWFDPTPYIKDSAIRVLMDRKNTRKYHVDISFLPKLAN